MCVCVFVCVFVCFLRYVSYISFMFVVVIMIWAKHEGNAPFFMIS